MPESSDVNSSRRRLLGQGLNASLGWLCLPQLWSGSGQRLGQRSLLAIATAPTPEIAAHAISHGPITVTIHFTAQANQSQALVNQLTQALSDARSAPGCRYAYVYEIAGNSNQVVLFKGWDSQEAQNEYLKWEQSSGRLATLLALVEGDPVVEYWDFQAA